jgi:hypothetical protein
MLEWISKTGITEYPSGRAKRRSETIVSAHVTHDTEWWKTYKYMHCV